MVPREGKEREMQESMHKYFKMGFVHFMAYPAAMKHDNEVILKSIESACKDPYFTAIEIMRIKDEDTRQKVKAMLDSSGMTVCHAAQPAVLGGKLNINSVDESVRGQAVEALTEELKAGREMGCAAIAFLSGKLEDGVSYEQGEAACIKSLQELCDRAAGMDMSIILETFDTDVDKRALIGQSEKAAALAAKVQRGNFGLMVDLSHAPLLGETPRQCLTAVKDHLVHVHVGNAFTADKNDPAYGDQHPGFSYPGSHNGVNELTDWMKMLFEIGYLGGGQRPVVSFEVKPVPGENSDIVLADAKRTMDLAWARV